MLERIVLVIVIALALLIGVGQWFMGRQSRRARTATVRRKARLLKRSTELEKASGEDATDGGDDKPPVPPASTHEAGDDESDRPGAEAGDDESDRPGAS
jgi:type II secretory pathway pseudopilin PulG